MKPKTDWCAIVSPKKQMNEFFFAMIVRKYLKLEISKYFQTVKQKKKNKFVGSVFWENVQPPDLLREHPCITFGGVQTPPLPLVIKCKHLA